LGVRLGLYAAASLELAAPRSDKRLLVFVETDGCFADGVAVATGCRLGRRTLRLADYGKVAVTAVDTATGRAVRVWPHPAARSRARDYAPEAPDRWHAQLVGYRAMPADELLLARAVRLAGALGALLGQPGQRVTCLRCGEEIRNGREVLLPGGPVCVGCAGGAYYRVSIA
jgi:formylmethanofuran dehydrogenase subunit E